jgi:hypothetical protein
VKLVSGANHEGYLHALENVFGKTGIRPPSKSSLSERRKHVSYRFFRWVFKKLIKQFEVRRPCFRGLRIYAVDGLQIALPRTKDVQENGYRGRSVTLNSETYYPRMYVTHAIDVLSEVTKDIMFSNSNDELKHAETMLNDGAFERNSLVIYDRLYISRRMLKAHQEAKNYFLMRVRRGMFPEADALFEGVTRNKTGINIFGMVVYFVAIKNPETKEIAVFATNLPRSWVKRKWIHDLYKMRWGVETSFRELVRDLKAEQWHSKSVNGILQEIYALLWLRNYTKIQIHQNNPKPLPVLGKEYFKPNFKLILSYIVENLHPIFKRTYDGLIKLPNLVTRYMERRTRYSKRHPRELKYSLKRYNFNNTVWIHET